MTILLDTADQAAQRFYRQPRQLTLPETAQKAAEARHMAQRLAWYADYQKPDVPSANEVGSGPHGTTTHRRQGSEVIFADAPRRKPEPKLLNTQTQARSIMKPSPMAKPKILPERIKTRRVSAWYVHDMKKDV